MNNEEKTKQAVDDIKLIREVLERAGQSLQTFSKIFICWGIIFALNAALIIFLSGLQREKFYNFLFSYPIFYFILQPFVLACIISGVILFCFTRTSTFNSLEKKIMTIWVCLFVLVIMCSAFPVTFAIPSGEVNQANIVMTYRRISIASSSTIFVCSLGCYIMSLFTLLKLPKIMAITYFLIGCMCIFIEPMNEIVRVVVWPLTFIILGIYLASLKGSKDWEMEDGD